MTNFDNIPVADFAARLAAMTKDEVFTVMSDLEAASECVEGGERDAVLARIALTGEEIAKRFPGQLLAPYREWKKRNR
ncbi:hypothetical protein LAC81_35645 (plasmid) [Ensifer adhaerens]|uniref:hypothetical protein n=1 Tax=Ensifer adhaerens TaxID=106592 RepID=UPI001CBB8914|nr:hypothetical protein [Ensifer adhaerens]MBZ7927278.1 hypothetical protein [Ensifer adhaerens]UAX98294.1 hypothetical protein LAC78_36945 [Ensifer adhaerens]UAY05676.1 hypothetical protein LAC80_35650 [Ensifer adhaerens]UAY13054.1 hypothetical protein LAC81_35645 [Ensifer adhaerens]